ncbi:MAG: sulfite exporter TauE/SafE family protein [Pseudomonadota bacterium]
MIEDPLFYAAAIPAVLLIGLSKGGFGGAIALLAVPLLSLRIPPIQAAGIMLPILICMDLVGLWAWRGTYNKKTLIIMIPAAIVGIVLGWLTAAYVTDAHIRLIVGCVALAFSAGYFLGGAKSKEARPHSWPKGLFWGAVAGFTSFVSHAGGPPYQMYTLPLRMDSKLFAGTAIIFFAAVNLVKVVPYFYLGQFNAENLATSAILLPLAPLATLAGVKLVKITPQDTFYAITYSAVLIVSFKLIWDGLTGL